MDMVSLAQPPLHTVPLFMHPAALTAADGAAAAPPPAGAASAAGVAAPPGEDAARRATRFSYEVPHWMNLSFIDHKVRISGGRARALFPSISPRIPPALCVPSLIRSTASSRFARPRRGCAP